MNEELMDEHAEDHNLVQPGWKISDQPSQADSAASTEQNSQAQQQRAAWGQRESGAIVRAPADDAEEAGNLSDGVYEDSDLVDQRKEAAEGSDRKVKQEKSDPLSMEETKTYEDFKEKVMEQPFYGSDEEAYIEDDD